MNEYDSYSGDHERTFGDQGAAQEGPNILGIIGLVLAVSCVLSPVGLLMSLVALTKPKKGFALAGTLVGAVMTVVVIGVTLYAVNLASKPEFKARIHVEADFRAIQQQIQASGSVPSTLNDPALNLSPDVQADYWGTEYVYNEDGAGNWTLTTLGPDGQPGGGDDATIPGDARMLEAAMALNEVFKVWEERMHSAPDSLPGSPTQSSSTTETDQDFTPDDAQSDQTDDPELPDADPDEVPADPSP